MTLAPLVPESASRVHECLMHPLSPPDALIPVSNVMFVQFANSCQEIGMEHT